MQIVLINEFLKDSSYRHAHVLIAVEGDLQIKIIDVHTHLIRPQGRDCTFPKTISNDGVCSITGHILGSSNYIFTVFWGTAVTKK